MSWWSLYKIHKMKVFTAGIHWIIYLRAVDEGFIGVYTRNVMSNTTVDIFIGLVGWGGFWMVPIDHSEI